MVQLKINLKEKPNRTLRLLETSLQRAVGSKVWQKKVALGEVLGDSTQIFP